MCKMERPLRQCWEIWFVLTICCSGLSSLTPFIHAAEGSPPRFKKLIIPEQIVTVNDNLKLDCKVRGQPKPAVEWYLNGDDLDQGERVQVIRNVLWLESIQVSDAGEYACKAKNKHGVKWSNFTVVVSENTEGSPPRFKKLIIPEQIVTVNDTLKLDCKVRGQPKPAVEWYLNGDDLDQGDRIKVIRNVLWLESIQVSDAGEYACKAINQHGLKWANFTVVVIENTDDLEAYYDDYYYDDYYETEDEFSAPVFIRKRDLVSYITRPASMSVYLDCRVEGNPEPSVSWYKNNKLIEIDGEKYGLSKKDMRLTIKDLTMMDKGQYRCMAVNSHGSIDFTFTLEVLQRIVAAPILDDIDNQTAVVGDNVTFSCEILLSDSQPQLQWLRYYKVNGSYYNENNQTHSRVLQESGWHKTVEKPQDLKLTNVSLDDAGLYTCLVANVAGINFQDVYLTVLSGSGGKSETGNREKNALSTSTWIYIAVGIGGGVLVALVVLLVYCLQKKVEYAEVRRVIIMKPNESYHNAPIIQPDQSGTLPEQSGTQPEQSGTQLFRFPEVYIERTIRRITSEQPMASEYEIPLDTRWEFPRARLTVGRQLGSGAFGVVHLAVATGMNSRENTSQVAVKMLKPSAGDQEVTDLVVEMEMLKIITGHRNVISLLGTCTQDGPPYVITEFAANGNLKDFLKIRLPSMGPTMGYEIPLNQRDSLKEKDLLSFAYQVARGMEYVSAKLCIHRDLAARNILVSEELVLKIADFGLTRNLSQADYYKKCSDGRLPIKWMAPEALFDGRYTTKSDVWAFGVLLWEIFSMGGCPYPSVPMEDMFNLLRTGYRMEQPSYSSDEVYQIMKNCWQQIPACRPSFTDIVADIEQIMTNQAGPGEEYLDLEPPEAASLNPEDSQDVPISPIAPNPADSQCVPMSPIAPNPADSQYVPMSPVAPNPADSQYVPMSPVAPNPADSQYVPMSPIAPNPADSQYVPMSPIAPNPADSQYVPMSPIAPNPADSQYVPMSPIAPNSADSQYVPMSPIAPNPADSQYVPMSPIAPNPADSQYVPMSPIAPHPVDSQYVPMMLPSASNPQIVSNSVSQDVVQICRGVYNCDGSSAYEDILTVQMCRGNDNCDDDCVCRENDNCDDNSASQDIVQICRENDNCDGNSASQDIVQICRENDNCDGNSASHDIVQMGRGNDNCDGNSASHDIVQMGRGNDNCGGNSESQDIVQMCRGNDNCDGNSESQDIVQMCRGNDNCDGNSASQDIVQICRGNDNCDGNSESQDIVQICRGNDNCGGNSASQDIVQMC